MLCARGLYDEAEPLAKLAHEAANETDVWAQALWRQAQALVDAASGRHAKAEQLVREAVAIGERTDGLNGKADAYFSLAEVLAAAGRTRRGGGRARAGARAYDRKRNVAMVAQVQPRLEQLRAEALKA